MNRHTLAAIAGIGLFAQVAAGQLVQFGPEGGVRVNAPFVRVEVGPAGETYVRAPFTSVYAPGPPGIDFPFPGGPVYARPIFQAPWLESRDRTEIPHAATAAAAITSDRLAQMSWRDLRAYLRDAASQLAAEFDRSADGAIWRDYLQPQAILALAADETDRAPTPLEIEQSRLLLRNFEGTVANRQLRRITDLPGFDAVLAGLRRMTVASIAPNSAPVPADSSADTIPATGDLRERLAASAMELDRELRRFELSAMRSYLELPVSIYAGSGTTESTVPDVAECELVLRRYDAVSRAPDYEQLSSLETFRNTRRLLSEYVARLRAPRRDPEPTPAELPSPEPLPGPAG